MSLDQKNGGVVHDQTSSHSDLWLLTIPLTSSRSRGHPFLGHSILPARLRTQTRQKEANVKMRMWHLAAKCHLLFSRDDRLPRTGALTCLLASVFRSAVS